MDLSNIGSFFNDFVLPSINGLWAMIETNLLQFNRIELYGNTYFGWIIIIMIIVFAFSLIFGGSEE